MERGKYKAEIQPIGDGRIVIGEDTFVNEKSRRVLSPSNFEKLIDHLNKRNSEPIGYLLKINGQDVRFVKKGEDYQVIKEVIEENKKDNNSYELLSLFIEPPLNIKI